MDWVYAIIALVAIGAGTTGVLSYNHALSRAETAEKAADSWKTRAEGETKRADRAQGDSDAADEIARQRGIALRTSNKRLANANAVLASLEASDPVVHNWADAVVPDAVRL